MGVDEGLNIDYLVVLLLRVNSRDRWLLLNYLVLNSIVLIGLSNDRLCNGFFHHVYLRLADQFHVRVS